MLTDARRVVEEQVSPRVLTEMEDSKWVCTFSGTNMGGGGGNFISNICSLHCHHQNDSALKWAVV